MMSAEKFTIIDDVAEEVTLIDNVTEEIILTDSDDDLNLGIVITDVKSLADVADDPQEIFGTDNVVCDQIESPLGSVEATTPNVELNSKGLESSTLALNTSVPQNNSPSLLTSSDLYATTSTSVSPSEDKQPSVESVSPSVDKQPSVELIPNIQQCLDGWRAIFPWVVFNFVNKCFHCRVCLWGYNYPMYYEVYKLNSRKLHIVAARLRAHSKQKYHVIAELEQKLWMNTCTIIYPLIKDDLLTMYSIDPIIGVIQNLVTQKGQDYRSIMNMMVENLALAIEEWHLESLRKSPYFSVVIFSSQSYVIVRWITSENLIVEHLFCSYIQKSKEALPVLAYLQFKGVVMQRMVSYSDLCSSNISINIPAKLKNVADRCCPVDNLLKCLKYAGSLQDLIKHVEALAKLYKISERCQVIGQFCKFTKGNESVAYKCLKVNDAVSTIFANNLYLDNLSKDFPDVEGFSELDFKKLSDKKHNPVIQTVCSIPKLNDIVENFDTLRFFRDVKSFEDIIKKANADLINYHGKRRIQNDFESDEGKDDRFVLGIIELFLSHILLVKTSQSMKYVPYIDILSNSMKNVRMDDLDKVFYVFVEELCGGKGFHQIMQLHIIFGKDYNTSPLKLISKLQEYPNYCLRFPELKKLGQMIMVIPTLNAHIERYSFDIAAAEALFKEKVDSSLIPAIMYIYLEGPDSVESLNRETILELFTSVKRTET